ncbi:Fc.00g007230.m01.CDS01 [Cosmosporella sp. VM-42]
MFTQPVSSPPPGPSPSTSAPSRPSRLRGLSYLRNYTQNHLLSREGHHNTSSGTGTGTGTGSSNGGSGSTSPNRQAQGGSGSGLTRSLSYSPTTSGPPQSTRLTLVSSTPDPARIATATVTSAPVSGAVAPAPTPTSVQSDTDSPEPKPEPAVAAADSATSSLNQVATNEGSQDQQPAMARARASTTGEAGANSPETLPSIRFSAYYDPRSTRPSLTFPPISRTLPTGSEKIRVGRYSERDSHSMSNMPGNQPSAAPVGFKSKVVSRRHCEFWYEDGKWYIKDVKSSSGTFLNHIRLSPPSQESKAFPVNDGDIVQLGIDFKGGEEMIFRCVKMRLELNRGWQNKLNTFNMAAHKRLQTLQSNGASGSSSQDCSICLGSIAPCQSLFVAPCSHTWHFKCVKSLLTSPQYPIFICPNCRAGADLEADVDELAEEWQQMKEEEDRAAEENSEPEAVPVEQVPSADTTTIEKSNVHDSDIMDVTVNITPESPHRGNLPHAVSEPLPIRNAGSGAGRPSALRDSRTPSPPGLNGTEGPITPRNDAGPWVFDGSAGRRADATTAEMTSLDAAADMDIGQIPSDDSSSR